MSVLGIKRGSVEGTTAQELNQAHYHFAFFPYLVFKNKSLHKSPKNTYLHHHLPHNLAVCVNRMLLRTDWWSFGHNSFIFNSMGESLLKSLTCTAQCNCTYIKSHDEYFIEQWGKMLNYLLWCSKMFLTFSVSFNLLII